MDKTVSNTLRFDDTSVAFAAQSNGKLRKTYFIFALMHNDLLVKLGTFFIKLSLKLGLPVKFLIRNTVFQQFCGGESIQTCQKTIDKLSKANIGTILDYSVEGEDTEEDFDKTMQEIIKTIDKSAQKQYNIPFSVFKITGIGSAELLEKAQESPSQLEEDEKAALQRIINRVQTLCQRASELNVRIFIDAEETWIQDKIDAIAMAMMEKYNQGNSLVVYNTYQLYRWDSLENLQRDCGLAQEKGYMIGAKLVRGAYLEKERRRAHEMNYKDPIHASKEETDGDYNKAIEFAIDNRQVLSICLGTHNEKSSLLCAQLMQDKKIISNDKHIWFAQLMGMSDNISYNLAKNGYNAAKYVPYGPVAAVMPYLFRRAEENASIAGQSNREFALIKKEIERRKNKA